MTTIGIGTRDISAPSVRERTMSLALAILAAYVVMAIAVFLLAERLIFQPPAASYARDDRLIYIPVAEGSSIAALYLPNDSARATIIYSHGNAEDIGHLAPFLDEMRSAGFSVLAYDYRGYGHSSATAPTVRGACEDIAAAYRYVRDSLRVPPRRIVLYGRSVGSGPATHLAAREEIGGLILEGAFVSAYRVVTRIPLFPLDRFPNLRNLAQVHVPVLVIHGMQDEVIPFVHGQRLFNAARGPKDRLWVAGAHHNDLVDVAGQAYWNALRAFGHVVAP